MLLTSRTSWSCCAGADIQALGAVCLSTEQNAGGSTTIDGETKSYSGHVKVKTRAFLLLPIFVRHGHPAVPVSTLVGGYNERRVSLGNSFYPRPLVPSPFREIAPSTESGLLLQDAWTTVSSSRLLRRSVEERARRVNV
jgi:hypothetical protein